MKHPGTICHDHMMSAVGDVEGYSVTSFWPRQEFDFADGGTLEFDVNINDDHRNRSWCEVMIVPRGGPNVAVGPYEYDEGAGSSTEWKRFRLELDPAQLQAGANTLTRTVGRRPSCSYPPYHWGGLSVTFLQIRTDR